MRHRNRVYRWLCAHGRCRAADIREALKIDHEAVYEALVSLEAERLVGLYATKEMREWYAI